MEWGEKLMVFIYKIKFFLLLVVLINTASFSQNIYIEDDVIFQNDVWVIKETNLSVTGTIQVYSKSGVLELEEPMINGKVEGIRISYRGPGEIFATTTFKNNNRHGVKKVYYNSNRLAHETHYINDIQDGVEKDFYGDGVLKCERYYKKGKLDGSSRDYTKMGILKLEKYYKNGKLDGSYKNYNFRSGKIMQASYYKNGQLHGSSKYYYESGELYEATHYKNGRRDGISREYSKSGVLQSEKLYSADEEIVKEKKEITVKKNKNTFYNIIIGIFFIVFYFFLFRKNKNIFSALLDMGKRIGLAIIGAPSVGAIFGIVFSYGVSSFEAEAMMTYQFYFYYGTLASFFLLLFIPYKKLHIGLVVITLILWVYMKTLPIVLFYRMSQW